MGNALYSPATMMATIRKLREEADRYNLQPHHLAADLLEAARKNNDIEALKFWRGVWVQIMSEDYATGFPPSRARRQQPGSLTNCDAT